MSIKISEVTPAGTLAAFLLDPTDMTNFEFGDLTGILVNMWSDCSNVLTKSLIDYIIIAACNQRRPKGLTRLQYIEMSYLLVPIKVKRASKDALQKYKDITGLFDYI